MKDESRKFPIDTSIKTLWSIVVSNGTMINRFCRNIIAEIRSVTFSNKEKTP